MSNVTLPPHRVAFASVRHTTPEGKALRIAELRALSAWYAAKQMPDEAAVYRAEADQMEAS